MSRVCRAGATVMASLLMVMMASGCSSATKESDAVDPEPALAALMKRPNLTQVEADYQSMFATIRDRLVSEVGVAAWVPDHEPVSGSSCAGDIANLPGAEVRRYNSGTSPGNLPDDKWDLAVSIVTEVAGQHGFGAPKVVISGPSDHEVSFRDTYNGELLFGTGANTILGGSTGCHLTEEAHQRGTSVAPPTRG